mgnify:CR=1 FL=1
MPAVRCRSIGAVSRVVGSLRHRVSDEGVKVDISVGVAVAVCGDSTALRSDHVQPAFRSGANAFEKRIIGEHRESSVNVRSIAIQHRSDVDRIVASPISLTVKAAPAAIGGNDTDTAGDLDGDGTFEDVNGDGELGVDDVFELFNNQDAIPDDDTAAFDFNNDGEFNVLDVQRLLNAQQEGN